MGSLAFGEVACFDTLLQVLILKGVTLHQNCAKCGLPQEVLILKTVKVICFDTAVQVLILKGLECTETVQDGSILLVLLSRDLGAAAGEKAQRRGSGNRARGVLARRPSWSAEFKDYASTRS